VALVEEEAGAVVDDGWGKKVWEERSFRKGYHLVLMRCFLEV